MDGITQIAGSISGDLKQRLPKQRKPQREKLALLVATMLDVRSANLMELAAGLPLAADRTDMRYQWIARLLSNALVVSDEVVKRHEELGRWGHEELDTPKSHSDLADVWPRAGLVHKASPALFAETVAVAADGDDVAVVEPSIQDGRGDHRLPEHLRVHQVSIDGLLTSRSPTRVIPSTNSGLNWPR